MITGFLLTIIFFFVSFLLGILPTGSAFPIQWTEGIYAIWSYINMFSFFIPVQMIVTCIAIATAFHLFVFAWKTLHWIMSIIRGSKVH